MKVNKKTLVLDSIYFGLEGLALIGFSALVISTGAINIDMIGKNVTVSVNGGLLLMIVSLLALLAGIIIARLHGEK